MCIPKKIPAVLFDKWPSLLYTFREPCPACDGSGLVSSIETAVTLLERWIKRFSSQTGERRLVMTVNPEVRDYLAGGVSSRIAKIMWANKVYISLKTDENLRIEEFRSFSQKQQKDVTSEFMVSSVSKKNWNQ